MEKLTHVEMRIVNPRLRELGGLPKRSSQGSAGYDLIACLDEPITINPGEVFVVHLGFSMVIPSPFWSAWFIPRSGLGVKQSLILANSVGLIDSDYRGECAAALHKRSSSDKPSEILPGDRIGQMVFVPVGLPEILEVEELTETTRSTGGFGSTGR